MADPFVILVIPAKAGTQYLAFGWAPACAGMTN